MQIILLGAPGSGKGTQSTWIEKEFNIPHISTGDIFRQAIKDQTETGILAKSYIEKGLLVPDEVTMKIVEDRIIQDDCKNGFLFDGFPRSLAQAEAFEKLASKLNLPIEHVIYLDVNNDVLLDRITGRRVCPKCGASYHVVANPPKVEGICDYCGEAIIQRKDDNPETMKQRLATFEEQTAPLIKFYGDRGLLRNINAMQEIGKIKEDIQAFLEK